MDIIVLQETMVTQEKLSEIMRRSFPTKDYMFLDAKGSEGGLGIFLDTRYISFGTCITFTNTLSRQLEYIDSLDKVWLIVV